MARLWPYVILLASTVLFRLPPLLNARGVHSDAAVVGLQAMHMLRGELDPLLWGTGYQGSFDALAVAAGFALFGTSALVLMLVPLFGHLLLTFVVYATLARHVSRAAAFVLTLPVVFTPQAVHAVALYAPRQWSITCVILAVWLLDRPGEGWRRRLTLFAGGCCAVLALYLDLYVLQMLPAVALFGAACAVDGRSWPERLRQVSGLLLGALAGALVVQALRGGLLAGQPTAILPDQISRNFRLLWETCLPWLLGYGVYIPGAGLRPDLWVPAAPVRVLQTAAGWSLLLFIASAAAFLFVRRVPWAARRLGALGLLVAASSIGGFLVSAMPADMWSTRYLAPVIWFSPFALAPLAWSLRVRTLTTALLPYLVVAAIGGWLSYGSYVDGVRPVLSARGVADEEARVATFLRQRDIRYAAAQYWLAYRLTFLFGENPVVVPIDPRQERYPPYSAGFGAAPIVAYIFHPSEPRESPGVVEPRLRQQGGTIERHEVAGFTVLVYIRP